MKKGFIRPFSVLLAAVMLLGIMSGCAVSDEREAAVRVDISTVPAMQSELTLRLSAENTSFNKKLTADDITLCGSFSDMDLEVVSVEKKKATIKLSGEIAKDETVNAYLDGGIVFGADALSDCETELYTAIGVESPSITLDTGKIELSEGGIILPLKIAGYVPADEISADQITVEDSTVEEVRRGDGGEILVKVLTDADDLASAAAAFDGKVITVSGSVINKPDGVTLFADLAEAGVSADFDYAEIKGGVLTMTFLLSVDGGSFSSEVNAGDISLLGDIAEAEITSIAHTDDDLTVIVSMPAGDATIDSMSFDVGFEVQSSALVNRWGGSPSENGTTERYITQSDMERYSALDFYDDAADFCSIVETSGITHALTAACPPVGVTISLITGAVTTAHGLMDLFGVLGDRETGPSEFEIISDRFDSLSRQLDSQSQKLNQLFSELKEVEKNQLRATVDSFTKDVKELSMAAASVDSYFKYATANLVSESDVPKKTLEGISEKLLANMTEGMTDEEILDCLSSDERALLDEWVKYNADLVDAMEKQAQKGGFRNNMAGLYKSVDALVAALKKVCIDLSAATDSPFDKYDQLCVYMYNFDKSALPARGAYRAIARSAMDHAMALLMQLYGAIDITLDNTELLNLVEIYYAPAVRAIDRQKVSLVTNDEFRDSFEANRATCYVAPSPRVAFEKTWFADGTSRADIEKFFSTMKSRLFWNNLTSSEKKSFKERMKLRGLTGDTVLTSESVYKEYALLGKNMIIDGKVGISENNFVITSYGDFELTEEYGGYVVIFKDVTYVYLENGDIDHSESLKIYCDPADSFGFYMLVFDGSNRSVDR